MSRGSVNCQEVIRIIRDVHAGEWTADVDWEEVFSGYDVIYGNPEATNAPPDPETGRRPREVNGENVNTLGRGDPNGTPGQRNAHNIVEAADNSLLTMSIHGVETNGSDCAFYGPKATRLVRGVASLLFPRAIIAAHPTIRQI